MPFLPKITTKLRARWPFIFFFGFILFYLFSAIYAKFNEKIGNPEERSKFPMFRYGQKHFKQPLPLVYLAFYTYTDPQTNKIMHGHLQDLLDTRLWGNQSTQFLINSYVFQDYYVPIIQKKLSQYEKCEILVRKIHLRPPESVKDILFPCNNKEGKLNNLSEQILNAP